MCSISCCFNKLRDTIHFQVSLPFLFMIWYASCDWWELWNILCSFGPGDPLWVCVLLAWTWVISLCTSLPPLLGALFNKVYHSFIAINWIFHFNRLIFSLYPQIILVMNTTGRNSVFLFFLGWKICWLGGFFFLLNGEKQGFFEFSSWLNIEIISFFGMIARFYMEFLFVAKNTEDRLLSYFHTFYIQICLNNILGMTTNLAT